MHLTAGEIKFILIIVILVAPALYASWRQMRGDW